MRSFTLERKWLLLQQQKIKTENLAVITATFIDISRM